MELHEYKPISFAKMLIPVLNIYKHEVLALVSLKSLISIVISFKSI